jgi:LacI family transcriptional regulator
LGGLMASVTIYDVAARADVSIKTVSRVMNNEPNVRPAMRRTCRPAAWPARVRS